MLISELRAYVWAQTDTTSADLPSSTIDDYVIEGFNRTIAAESGWPFYEQTWEFTYDSATESTALPIDVDDIVTVMMPYESGLRRLEYITQENAEESRWLSTNGLPRFFSVWAHNLYLWPPPAEDIAIKLRGYRRPLATVWDASGVIDCDDRLKRPLAHYACSLAYAQQEDEVLERTYMERWQRDVEMARQAIMSPLTSRPLVMHSLASTAGGMNSLRRRGRAIPLSIQLPG